MTRYGIEQRLLAITLSALSGFVDALGFIYLGGFFISFMSGNSTRLGVGIVQDLGHAAISGGLILCFLIGVVIGSLVAHRGPKNRACTVLLLVAAMLAAAAAFHAAGLHMLAVGVTALSMGAINCIFVNKGEVTTGVTYMTGTLVKLGQGLSRVLLGEKDVAWGGYLQLWLGLVAGAMLGTYVYGIVGLAGLWFAAGVALLLSMAATKVEIVA